MQTKDVDAAGRLIPLARSCVGVKPCLVDLLTGIASALAIVLSLLGSVGCSRESRYPDQPITLICPWSPGGGTDRVSRQVAAQLEEQLGVPVSVINATGGSGVTGHTRGATARPDGYTLTMITVELNLMHWRGLTNITYRDFAPLQLINRDSAALFVRSDSPYVSLDELPVRDQGYAWTLESQWNSLRWYLARGVGRLAGCARFGCECGDLDFD